MKTSILFLLMTLTLAALDLSASPPDMNVNTIRREILLLLEHEDGVNREKLLVLLDKAAEDYLTGTDLKSFQALAAFLLTESKSTLEEASNLVQMVRSGPRKEWHEDFATVSEFKIAYRRGEYKELAHLVADAKKCGDRLDRSAETTVVAFRLAADYGDTTFHDAICFFNAFAQAEQGKFSAALRESEAISDLALQQEVMNYVTSLKNPINLKEIEDAALKRNIDEQKAREASE